MRWRPVAIVPIVLALAALLSAGQSGCEATSDNLPRGNNTCAQALAPAPAPTGQAQAFASSEPKPSCSHGSEPSASAAKTSKPSAAEPSATATSRPTLTPRPRPTRRPTQNYYTVVVRWNVTGGVRISLSVDGEPISPGTPYTSDEDEQAFPVAGEHDIYVDVVPLRISKRKASISCFIYRGNPKRNDVVDHNSADNAWDLISCSYP